MTARLFDTFTGRLRLEGLLTTRTALHIGAGGSGDLLGTDLPVVRDGAGRPYIPGSSLKGVLRSAAEALFHGAPFADRSPRSSLWACRMMAGSPCVTHEKVTGVRAEKETENRQRRESERQEAAEGRVAGAEVTPPADVSRWVAETVWEESCTVCRIFGSLEIASRVRFPDLPLVGDSPVLELRNGVGIDRDKGLAADKVLYDFEAVPPGTSFRLTVLLDNPDDTDVGLLLYLFSELDQGNLALGGKSSRGLGLVQIQWDSMIETNVREKNPFAGLLSSRDLLKSPATARPLEDEPSGPALPATGDPAAWKTIADLLLELPEVDKGLLGQKAGALGLNKTNLNDKLALGLGADEKKNRKAWDFVLDRLVTCGFLVENNGKLVVASRVTAKEQEEAIHRPGFALQEVIDRFVGALGRRWEEAC